MRCNTMATCSNRGVPMSARTGLASDLSQLFEEFFGPSLRNFANDGVALTPRMDLAETETAYTAQFDLPGLTQEQIDVELKDNVLRVSGEKLNEQSESKDRVHRTERLFGRFERRVRIPGPVQKDKVEATFKNGVLAIVLPKVDASEGLHKIAVKPA